MHHFSAQSGPFTSNNFFISENLLMSLVFLINVYLHAKNQIQIISCLWNTDDLRILKSHWLRAIFSFTWELDFSQACSFLRVLMNHKTFDFTQIPNKTYEVNFLKSPKTMFWGIFDHFYLMGVFSKKSSSVTHNYTWTPNIMLSFRKN